MEKLTGNKFRTVIEDTESRLLELIVLDVAHQHSSTGHKVLPDRAESFFKSSKKADFLESQIEKSHREASESIDEQSVSEARVLVEKFLKKRRFIDLLPGHFAFGILRRLIIDTVTSRTRKNLDITNENIRVLLSVEVWRFVNTPDHNSLKRRLRKAVREVEHIRNVTQ